MYITQMYYLDNITWNPKNMMAFTPRKAVKSSPIMKQSIRPATAIKSMARNF